MNLALLIKKIQQKRCNRCELYYDGSLDKCVHCSYLNNSQLQVLKAQHQQNLESNSIFGKYLLFGAVIIVLILLLSVF